ncbi:MAG: MBL fold metallo-hydrolase [Acidilobaceae archaeon]
MTIRIVDATPDFSGFSSVYLVSGERSSALIDSGPSNGWHKVFDYVKSLGVKVDYIILTHVHIDHGGASGLLSRELDSIVIVHPRGARHIIDPSVLWEQSKQALGPVADYYGKPTPVEESRVRVASDGDIIDLGGVRLKLIFTPGHASHHLSVYVENEGLMFTGDSAGVFVDLSVRVPTTPPPFKPKLYLESIEKMIRENPRRVALAHYGLVDIGVEYLKWHAREITLWLDEISRMISGGLTDPIEIAERLAGKLENARIARSSRIAHLYYNTIVGLTRAVLDGEWS